MANKKLCQWRGKEKELLKTVEPMTEQVKADDKRFTIFQV